jgi:hypothetical protein
MKYGVIYVRAKKLPVKLVMLWVYAGVGEPGQTVNLLRKLSRFESYYAHKKINMKKIKELINRFDSLMPEHYIDGVKQAKLSTQLVTLIIMLSIFFFIISRN